MGATLKLKVDNFRSKAQHFFLGHEMCLECINHFHQKLKQEELEYFKLLQLIGL